MSKAFLLWGVSVGILGYFVRKSSKKGGKKPIVPHSDDLPVLDESLLQQQTHTFPELKNDLILRAATGKYTERVPIWCHRQAGRYLPEFREVRKQGDFFTICRTPVLATEITLQPIRRYPFDAAIIFSDILVVPQAVGLECVMVPGKGPVFPEPLLTPAHLKRLKTRQEINVAADLKYVFDALTLTRYSLAGRVPLLGFSGAPWTLMAYMVEGGGAKSFNKARSWLCMYPEQSHYLLSLLTDVIIEYLVLQVQAGAQMLEVFDSWASDVTPADFQTFLFPYLQRIATGVKAGLRDKGLEVVPMTVFAKGANYAFRQLQQETDFDCVSLDWNVDPATVREQTDSSVTLQGNLDPAYLFGSDAFIRSKTRQMVDRFGTQRYIANLGHGMLPTHSPDKLAVYIDEIHKYSEEVNSRSKTS
mmetsp:Transcript_50127/g.98272  ORF Transcript_50127/g.98272 Transcript_50127/m.98272 type:complete len:417 (-) Transcript_50127:90-1340(-)|eukprot:CAMPEP_0175150306 /NCGR_PEP_ID=MMETSP0087-20121206/17788_1 /TAXON_ID=136419 /ORGANISM="Unknown Unknown, Strain D1" /LENGTH=416 /DNA_ID=CAMNT_0016436219 /DNA_START=75 /DNA_END=1328 /DNA_ORIENTATION=+